MASRSYSDFESVGQAMDGIVRMFEHKLQSLNPHVQKLSYDISDLFAYIDSLGDLSILVYNPDVTSYSPFGKEWIKRSVFQHLKRQAEQ